MPGLFQSHFRSRLPSVKQNGKPVPTATYSWIDLTSASDNTTVLNYLFEPSTVITPPFMTVQSKTMKDSISEGGNNTEKENEIAQLNQLNNELLAKVAALNKEKLTWSSGSGNDTSASNVVEMPLPPAQRRLVHSFIITRAFVKVKFIMGENLYRNCPTLLTALYKHVGIGKEQEKYGSDCKKIFARETNQKRHNVKLAVGTKYKSTYVRSEKRVLLH